MHTVSGTPCFRTQSNELTKPIKDTTMGKSNNIKSYEQELRNLVRCDDDPSHPTSAFGRSRRGVYEYFRRKLPFLYADICLYVTAEAYYRAVEYLACLYLPEAREALGYVNDDEDLPEELFYRVRRDVELNRNEGHWAEVEEWEFRNISLQISCCAFFLAFGMRLKGSFALSGLFDRFAEKLVNLMPEDSDCTYFYLFPRWKFKGLGIPNRDAFVKRYEDFVKQVNALCNPSECDSPADLYLIDSDIENMDTRKVNYYSLTANSYQLEQFLHLCLKKGTEKAYIKKALEQWEASREKALKEIRTGNSTAEKEVKRLQQELEEERQKRAQQNAEIESWRALVKDRDKLLVVLRKDINRMEKEAICLSEEKKALEEYKQKWEENKQRKEEYLAEIDLLKNEQNEAEKKISEMSTIIDKCYTEMECLRSENEQLKASLSCLPDGADATPEALQSRIDALQCELAEWQFKVLDAQKKIREGEELQEAVVSALHYYERMMTKSGLLSELVAVETKLMDLFANVPLIKDTITQMRHNRLREASVPKQEGEKPTIHIEQNHGTILMSPVEQKKQLNAPKS